MSDEDADELPEWASTMFWALVLIFNVALFFSAVGVMVLYFERDWTLGGAMLVIGAISWTIGLGTFLWSRRRFQT